MMTETTGQNEIVNFIHHVVCLMDVLNQGEELEKLKDLPSTPEEKDDFIKKIKNTFGTVQVLRTMFRDYFSRFRDSKNPPDERITRILRQRTGSPVTVPPLNLGEQYFSDLFIFYAPLSKVEEYLSVREVYAMLTASAVIMQVSLAGRVAMRGGIDVGIAAEWMPNEVYGPALNRAHRLESGVAGYPRIVVGPELLQFLTTERARPAGGSLPCILNKTMANLCLSMVKQDVDGIPFVDFLGDTMRGIAGSIDDAYKHMIQKGAAFVAQEHEKFKANALLSEHARKLALRYSLLNDYYHGRIALWT